MTDSPAPRRSGVLPLALVLVTALAAGLGLLAAQRLFGPQTAAAQPPVTATLLYPKPRTVAPFSLDQADGSALTEAALRGRWTLLFIGFTHCPDVCPTTLGLLASVSKRWADRAPSERPQVLFVSVDPDRDTPAKAAEYAHFFSPEILAATADHERLTAFTSGLGMVYMKTPLEGGDYTVDHSSSIAIISPAVELVGVMRPPLQAAAIGHDLDLLMEAAR